MEMSVYSHKANDRFRRDKISILEQLGICISKEKEKEVIVMLGITITYLAICFVLDILHKPYVFQHYGVNPLTVAYYTFCVILQVVALIGFLTDVKDSFDCNNR